MKLIKTEIDNFSDIKTFTVEWDRQHTRLIGMNGAGKTTIGLTSLWAAIKGISTVQKHKALPGQRYRYIGPNKKSVDLKLTFEDTKLNATIVVTRHFTESKSSINFQSDHPDIFHKGWLENFLSVSFLSARHFISLTPKEQAIELGIDTQEYDTLLANLKQEFTFLNRQFKELGVSPVVDKVAPVDITTIAKARTLQLEKYNTECNQITSKNEEVNRITTYVKERQKQIESFRETILAFDEKIKQCKKEIDTHMPLPLQEDLPVAPDVSTYDKELEDAVIINQKAVAYKESQRLQTIKDDKKDEIDENQKQQSRIQSDRLKFIQKYDLKFAGLTIDEKGGLLLDERPIQEPYFSHAETEIIVAKLHVAVLDKLNNPHALKFRFLDNFDLLDKNKQKEVLQYLFEAGFQVATAEVGIYEGTDPNVICLSEIPSEPDMVKPSLI